MSHKTIPLGAGLGLRRELCDDFLDKNVDGIAFLEVAPENWMGMGGRWGKKFAQIAEQHHIICHGLSMSLGAPGELDHQFIKNVANFLDKHHITTFSEHLSFCSDNAHLYDLMPIPFTEESIKHVSKNIAIAQDILQRPLPIENASYYTAPGQELSEIEFIKAIIEEADCRLLLDVNNIYVNSVNHAYDAGQFLRAMPSERIEYLHVAGHYQEAEDLIVDTHGADVIDPVWALLEQTYHVHGVFPTLLERDFNIPEMPELLNEIQHITQLQTQALKHSEVLTHV